MKAALLLFYLFLIFPLTASATNFTMVNRSVNFSNNINYVVTIDNSSRPMNGAQVTFNYDPTAFRINWVKQGDFLYFSKEFSKIWYVWNVNGSGKLMAVSMIFWEKSINQTKKSTFMTINMKPLRKGVSQVNLSAGVLLYIGEPDINPEKPGGMNINYSIKVT
jgi:Cohesin domain